MNTNPYFDLNQELFSEHLNENLAPLLTDVEKQAARDDLAKFALRIHPEWKLNWHHQLMCESIERVIKGIACAELKLLRDSHGAESKIVQDYVAKHAALVEEYVPLHSLIISMPPGGAKSSYGSRLASAWALGNFPDWAVILACYNSDKAAAEGTKAQEVVRSAAFHEIFPDVQVDRKKEAGSDWKIEGTRELSSMLSTGLMGTITGFRARLFLVDDPVKNHAEAHSATLMKQHFEWYVSVADSRLFASAGASIIIMTRWTDEDLAGQLIEKNPVNFEVLTIPALAEEEVVYTFKDGTTYTREVGEALWPAGGMTVEYYEAKRSLDAIIFECMYQQNPVPQEGMALDMEDLQPCTVQEWEESENWPIVYGVDLATGTGADYSVIAKLRCNIPKGFAILYEMKRGKWNLDKLTKILKDEFEKDQPFRIVMESNAFQSMIATHIKTTERLPIHKSHTSHGKIQTHNAIYGTGAQFSGGRILMPPTPEHERNLMHFRHEWQKFPGGKNDDCLDATAKAIEAARLSGDLKPREKVSTPFSRKQTKQAPTMDNLHPLLKQEVRRQQAMLVAQGIDPQGRIDLFG